MNDTSNPCVSVIIPTYNRALLLKESINSICLQTFSSWEIIVVDDNSTDTTQHEVSELINKGISIRYIKNTTEIKGPSACRNCGLKIAKGRYIIFLDSDDLLATHCLSKRVMIMDSDPDLDFAVFQCHKFRESQHELGKELWSIWESTTYSDDLDSFLSHQVLWQTAGPIWRRESLDRLGEWTQCITFGEDFEYHVRALAKDFVYKKINEVDYFWRLPRLDSFSGFESKKRSYSQGEISNCFLIILDLLLQSKKLNQHRIYLLERDARNIAINTMLFGGKTNIALRAFKKLYTYRLISTWIYLEYVLIFTLWFKSIDRIPSLTYLNWRFSSTVGK